MDLKCLLLFLTITVSTQSVHSQITQCTSDEYRSVVLNLESLRAQFKTFQAEASAEIANLKTTVAAMNETIKSLSPEQVTINVRLVGGNASNEGRVEVQYNDEWGTVCDDSFDDNDAKVICRMLNYTGVANGYGSATFGEGTGRIWLDELSCLGTETTLFDCRHNSWGDHDCDHDEDASVRCSNDML